MPATIFYEAHYQYMFIYIFHKPYSHASSMVLTELSLLKRSSYFNCANKVRRFVSLFYILNKKNISSKNARRIRYRSWFSIQKNIYRNIVNVSDHLVLSYMDLTVFSIRCRRGSETIPVIASSTLVNADTVSTVHRPA